MIDTLTAPLSKELERHPVTLLVVTCLVGFSLWSWSQHARAEDIETLHIRIDTVSLQYQTLEISINRATLESQIENLDREMFSLEREIEKAELQGEPLPPLYEKRLSELRIIKDKKVRELDRLDDLVSSIQNDQ